MEKVSIDFDLTNREMVMEALSMPELYNEMLAGTMVSMAKYILALKPKKEKLGKYEDDNMSVNLNLRPTP